MESPFIHKALLQQPVGDKVRCLTCERRCLIGPGEAGWCSTRENRNGTLVTLTYGAVSSISANPIEKKPLYHFYPGSQALTVGSYSCNFPCPWCQNWDISKSAPGGGTFYSPAQFVAEAITRRCQGTSISLNEPTLSLEWSLEVFRLARQAGLYNTFVTNGYMTERALDELARAGLDGMNVDVKGGAAAVRTHCQANVEMIWRNLRRAREMGIWIEIATLVVPEVNDDRVTFFEIADRMVGELGPQTPWHITRYQPAYQFDAPPPQQRLLEEARSIGREAGLHHVYVGNIAGHFAQNTYCSQCGKMLVQRWGMATVKNFVEDGRCPACHHPIAGVGWDWQHGSA